jgi:hypothetical protein
MEQRKYRRIYVEWWRIRKSTISGLLMFIGAAALIGGGGWWALQHDWFAATDASEMPKDAARIIAFEGDVRITRAATRETIVVTKETFVAAGDTIQTQADGRATIQMIDGSVYTVRANSTIVVRDNSSIFGSKNVRVALDDGQLNVRTDQQPGQGDNVVEMLESETELDPQTDASFNADAGTKGGEIRISRGSVETTIGGSKTTITENEYAAVNNGRIASKEQLIAPPRPVAPQNMAQLGDASGGLTVTFSWQDQSPSSGYYLQVARSPFFASDSILVDRGSLNARDFRLAGLGPGNYYWRVKATAPSGQVSEWSEPAKFSVVRREASADIAVSEWSVQQVGGNVYIISGKTQPGLAVRAQGRETFALGDRSFRLQISTPQAEVPIEMSDDRGNRAGFVLSLRNGRVVRRF